MKNPFHGRLPSFNAEAVQQTIQRALAAGGLAGQLPPAMAQPSRPGRRPWPGQVETHRFSGPAGSRAYQLYVPASAAASASARPLLVMLHGCTQSADDFAAGTGMNRLAEAHGCLVVYPEQAAQANSSRCWNWFSPPDQRREGGEPSLIAGIVQEVAGRHGADRQRIYVAGLSAGAAMAVVMGQTHPELFAGIGAHSGLPFACAHDVGSALAAMKGGRSGAPGLRMPSQSPLATGRRTLAHFVPTIVVHGDRDHTVQQSNGAEIVRQAVEAFRGPAALATPPASTQRSGEGGARPHTRCVHASSSGRSVVESWTVHGAGHAWSGGDPAGSYTDASGPDASSAMMEFFLGLPDR